MNCLTSSQEIIFNKFIEFLESNESCMIISGSAGTGKTFLTSHISNYVINNTAQKICAVAPTHKARRVLDKMLNKNRVIVIPTFTVASILGKIKEDVFIGRNMYNIGTLSKMDSFNIFLVDEVSMICDTDVNTIMNYIKKYNKKVIFIGDKYQIPPISQPLKRKDNVCYKPDSMVFKFDNIFYLNEIVRQAENSYIIKLASYIKDNINNSIDFKDIFKSCNIDKEQVVIDKKDIYNYFSKVWKERNDYCSKMISYTNSSVRIHNKNIRNALEYKEDLVPGELLTAYTTSGFPIPIIENGIDYIITDIRRVSNYSIAEFSNLTGNLIKIKDLDKPKKSTLFLIDLNHSSNQKYLEKLIQFALKANKPYSTKHDFVNYKKLKNQAFFMEDLYYYKGEILISDNIKQNHSLLFTKIEELIDIKQKEKRNIELVKNIEIIYGNIIDKRLKDNKIFADGEMLVDKYMVIEKDLYYGYSTTTHKSQGSTFNVCYVDFNDFDKITDKWNYRYRVVEKREKERNQLIYVAVTRASEKLILF